VNHTTETIATCRPPQIWDDLARSAKSGTPSKRTHAENGERALFDDHDRASRMRMPARGAARVDCDLRHSYVRSELKRQPDLADSETPASTLLERRVGALAGEGC
jgi:hypothetical protein